MVILVMLIVALLPHAVFDAPKANCKVWHPQFVHHKYDQPGDLIIGGVVFQNLFLISESTFKRNPPQPLLDSMFIQNYQHVLALEFTVKEINENQQLLPNITLGFSIYDSYVEARWTYHAILQLISPKGRFIPNYKCGIQGNLMALIAELTSDITHEVPEVLGLYKIPQLLYGSAAVSMDKDQALSVFLAEPNGFHEYGGILQLLLYFKWTWIGFIAANEMNLQWFMEVMLQEFSKHGICFAVLESFSTLAHGKNMEQPVIKYYDEIMNYNINVSVFFGDTDSLLWLRWLLITKGKSRNQKPRGNVWILTAQMDLKYSASYNYSDSQDFHGSLSFATHSSELQGFQSFLQSRDLSSSKEDGFIKGFLENAFQCTFSSSPAGHTERAACTGEERLESLPEYIFPMSVTGQSYTIYNAVYAVAHALHAMHVSKSKNRAMQEREKRKFQNQQSWQLHHFLKMVSFNNSVGDQISFDQKRELVAGFDIINWVTFPNQTISKVKVGSLDPQVPPNEAISINKDVIVWHSWFNQAQPVSLCNDNCGPGYSKKNREGEPFCCYDCIPCPTGKVSDQKDMADCFTCPSDQYPNKQKTSCIPRVVVFLSYEDPVGIGLAICASSFVLVTTLVLWLFVKHHNSPIVKVNNRSLTYTILISLLLCFLGPLINIGRPQKVTCILRQIIFGISFTMAVSSVLAKTVTVVLAFKATRPGSTLKNWMGKKLAIFIILSCSSIQTCICILSLSVFPSFVEVDMYSYPEEICMKCYVSPTIVYCETFFFGSLAVICFTLAFLARKLPDVFNEAKFITFSMFGYWCVWMSFVPVYHSIKGKIATSMETLSVLASTAALLVCMFFPKCYIILLKPQLNRREQLRKWKH